MYFFTGTQFLRTFNVTLHNFKDNLIQLSVKCIMSSKKLIKSHDYDDGLKSVTNDRVKNKIISQNRNAPNNNIDTTEFDDTASYENYENDSDDESDAHRSKISKKSVWLDSAARKTNRTETSFSTNAKYSHKSPLPGKNSNLTSHQISHRKPTPSSTDTKFSSARSSSAHSHGTSYSRSSPNSGGSVDMPYVYTADINTRLLTLENKVNSYEARLKRLEEADSQKVGHHHQEKSIELLTWQNSTIGTFVRDEMFKAIKFLDAKVLRSQGQRIFDRALKAISMTDHSGHKQLYTLVIKKCKHYLNNHKCHIISNIRDQAKGKFACILILNFNLCLTKKYDVPRSFQ